MGQIKPCSGLTRISTYTTVLNMQRRIVFPTFPPQNEVQHAVKVAVCLGFKVARCKAPKADPSRPETAERERNMLIQIRSSLLLPLAPKEENEDGDLNIFT